MSGTTSPILSCLLVEGTPIVPWIEGLIIQVQGQIDALKAIDTAIQADITTIETQITALQALVTALQACCDSIQQYIADQHKALTLTQTQDVANRITLATNQILNLPPRIRAQLYSDPLAAPLNLAVPSGGILTPLSGIPADFQTAPNMAATGVITIPKTGRYLVNGSWSANVEETDPAQGYSIGIGFSLNGATGIGSGFSRFTAPLIHYRAEQVSGIIPAIQFTAGDQISILAFTDYPSGVTAYGAYLYVEYLDGV